jgi:ribosomal protein S18 acetylase RimI-like enzyme
MDTTATLSSHDGSVEISPASWHDLGAIRELERICFPMDAWPWLDLVGVLIFPNIVRHKAVLGSEIVGFVAGDVKRYSNTGWIASICVRPDFRGRGVGGRLLRACEEGMGMPRVKLSVRESNRTAIEMYRHYGYRQVGVWRDYYKGGENGIVMEKVLEGNLVG